MYYFGVMVCKPNDYVITRNKIIAKFNSLDRNHFLNLIKNNNLDEIDTSKMRSTVKSLYDFFTTDSSDVNIQTYTKSVRDIYAFNTLVTFLPESNTIFFSALSYSGLDKGMPKFFIDLIDSVSWPARFGRNKTVKGAHLLQAFLEEDNNAVETLILEGINPPSALQYVNLDPRLREIEDITTQPPEAAPEELEEEETLPEAPLPEPAAAPAPAKQVSAFPLAREVHNITVHSDTLDV